MATLEHQRTATILLKALLHKSSHFTSVTTTGLPSSTKQLNQWSGQTQRQGIQATTIQMGTISSAMKFICKKVNITIWNFTTLEQTMETITNILTTCKFALKCLLTNQALREKYSLSTISRRTLNMNPKLWNSPRKGHRVAQSLFS